MKKLAIFLMTAVVFFLAGASGNDTSSAQSFYDLVDERYLYLYENEVAKEKVFSQYSENELTKMAVDNAVSVDKVKILLVYCHASKSIGKNYTIKQADGLPSFVIMSDAKAYVEYLKKTRTPEELKSLEDKFNAINKSKTQSK